MKFLKGKIMSKVNAKHDDFFALMGARYGTEISRKELVDFCEEENMNIPQWLTSDPAYRVSRGVYKIPTVGNHIEKNEKKSYVAPVGKVERLKNLMAKAQLSEVPVNNEPIASVTVSPSAPVENTVNMAVSQSHTLAPVEKVQPEISFVPIKARGYVPFGAFNDIRQIITSDVFYPVFITGLSGNGKTMMVEQCCAAVHKECIRVNITAETDEDDLLGGFRLIAGHTVWQDGPVIVAMERGCKLLLDEVDLSSSKIMCLQPVLEGSPVFLKKIGRLVRPTKGFNVLATANTKGKGSEDGRFIGTNIINEAFLERFAITIEQEYPSMKTESKILNNILKSHEIEDETWVKLLVSWADAIRKTFAEGGADEIISTRRLVHIVEALAIFKDKKKAVNLCLSRFDQDTKTQFLDLYSKMNTVIDEAPEIPVEVSGVPVMGEKEEEIPF